MTSQQDQRMTGTSGVVLSIDAMGGDQGPAAVVAGIAASAEKNPEVRFILHGDSAVLDKLVAKSKPLAGRCEIRHADGVVSMDDKPSQVMRHGKGTSMWSALESVRDGEATVAVSCGNTGALMALSMVRLRKLPGVSRPAIAILWPSRSPQGFNVMLDVGADIRADAKDLLQYALMGVSYARNGLALELPRVGLLNVGTEEHKGRSELHDAHHHRPDRRRCRVRFRGFRRRRRHSGQCRGRDRDGRLHRQRRAQDRRRHGEPHSRSAARGLRLFPLSRIASLLAFTSLKRLSKRIDPRRVNGGVFLGLNGTVVKSHGAADATGISAAVKLAFRLAESGFTDRLKARVASAAELAEDAVQSADEDGTHT